jgi:hypothetical protein
LAKARRNQSTLLQLKRTIRLAPLIALIYCASSGGPYGLETAISSSGVGITLILILVMPLVLSIPMSLMAAELGSALPLEGGSGPVPCSASWWGLCADAGLMLAILMQSGECDI